MNIDMSKILSMSARIAFAVLATCVILLFFPATLLPFNIITFREKYGIWLFVISCLSVGILASYVVRWCAERLKCFIEKKKLWKGYGEILKMLSDDEKKFIIPLYEERKTAIMYSLSNPVAKKLETFKIISMSAGTNLAPRGLCPGFVQPWVFEVIDKHPEYLKLRDYDKDKK